MIIRLLSILVLIGLSSSCSLRNDFGTTSVAFRAGASQVKSSEFARVSIYDKACLTISGNGKINTGWYDIEKTPSSGAPDSMKVEIKVPNLLGGYSYQFTLFAVDTGNSNFDASSIQSSCPEELPNKDGWAKLGRVEQSISVESDSVQIDMSLAFEQPITYVPNKPTGLSSTPGDGKVTLSWNEPYDGGEDIEEYVIQVLNPLQVPPLIDTQTTNGTSDTVKNLINGQLYQFRVLAQNKNGQGELSDIDSETPNGAVPTITITSQPTDVTAVSGNASFNVSATLANAPAGTQLTYQWQKEIFGVFSDISGETGDTLQLENLTASDSGVEYRVVVSASGATSVNSNTVTLTVLPPVITITSQPTDVTAVSGNASFSVSATLANAPAGTQLTYQWQKEISGGFSDIIGETGDNLQLENLTTSDNGAEYRVVVSAAGAANVTSSAAHLTVLLD